MAMEDLGTDGILIHMLLGKLKPGDIPADVRDASIRKMVDVYFPPNTVMVTGYGFDMLYAGPREAVLHAVFRQNSGCSHLIVGRDHAGVGDYYGGFDAQTIFDEEVPAGALLRRLAGLQHARGHLVVHPAAGMPVLVDEGHRPVVMDRHHRRGAGVSDDLQGDRPPIGEGGRLQPEVDDPPRVEDLAVGRPAHCSGKVASPSITRSSP